jgi:hypothetical protein
VSEQQEGIVMTQETRERKLRQDINAIWNRKYGYPDWVLKKVMERLGFGNSLRALDEERLGQLKQRLVENRRHGKPDEFTYDRQGMFMFSLLKQVGWSEADLRFHLIKRFSKTHWNVLNPGERRGVIAMLFNYINKRKEDAHGAEDPEEGTNVDGQSGAGVPGEGTGQGTGGAGRPGEAHDGEGDQTARTPGGR